MNSIKYLYIVFTFVISFSCSHERPIDRSTASINKTSHVDGSENIPQSIKTMLDEEQNLHVKGLWPAGSFSSDISPEYVPEVNPKFPIAYYLIPSEDANFLSAKSLDPRVLKQISIQDDSGKKYYKLFVHPESEEHYSFLKEVYQYISQENSEHIASPTSSYRSLVLWNKYNSAKKPFIAKVSLDRNIIRNIDRLVSSNEVERSIANQNAFNEMGEKSLEEMNAKIFPESAGLTIAKSHRGEPSKLGGQLIREIPDEVWTGHKKWVAWATLISPERGPPMILKVIKASGLSTRDFINTYMIEGYMTMFEKLSLKTGINFEPHSQNLGFELMPDFSPTGKWIHKDFGGVWPDIITLEKSKGPLRAYMEKGNALKYKFKGGRANAIGSYVFFYKRQIFDFLIKELEIYSKDLLSSDIDFLNRKINTRFVALVNKHLNLNLTEVPTMKTYKKIQKLVNGATRLDSKIKKTEIKDRNAIGEYIQSKALNDEWVTLSDSKITQARYYITDNGVYELREGIVTGFALFNDLEMANYKHYGPNMKKISTRPYTGECSFLLTSILSTL